MSQAEEGHTRRPRGRRVYGTVETRSLVQWDTVCQVAEDQRGPALNGLFHLKSGAHGLCRCHGASHRAQFSQSPQSPRTLLLSPRYPKNGPPLVRSELPANLPGESRKPPGNVPAPPVCQVPLRRWRWPSGNSFRAEPPSKKIPRG